MIEPETNTQVTDPNATPAPAAEPEVKAPETALTPEQQAEKDRGYEGVSARQAELDARQAELDAREAALRAASVPAQPTPIDPYAQEYQAYQAALQEEVDAGRMGETLANVQLASKQTELLRRRDDDWARQQQKVEETKRVYSEYQTTLAAQGIKPGTMDAKIAEEVQRDFLPDPITKVAKVSFSNVKDAAEYVAMKVAARKSAMATPAPAGEKTMSPGTGIEPPPVPVTKAAEVAKGDIGKLVQTLKAQGVTSE